MNTSNAFRHEQAPDIARRQKVCLYMLLTNLGFIVELGSAAVAFGSKLACVVSSAARSCCANMSHTVGGPVSIRHAR